MRAQLAIMRDKKQDKPKVADIMEKALDDDDDDGDDDTTYEFQYANSDSDEEGSSVRKSRDKTTKNTATGAGESKDILQELEKREVARKKNG